MFGWSGVENVLFFVVSRMLEAVMTLGVIALVFGPMFPTYGILQAFRSSLVLGSLRIAILQYLLFVIGMSGLMFPFPFNMLLVSFWIASVFLFSLAQPVFVVEGLRGINALTRSFQITTQNLSRTFVVIFLSNALQFLMFAALLQLLMPDLAWDTSQNTDGLRNQLADVIQNPEVIRAVHYTQYLTAFLLYPFAAVVSVLLYFDLSRESPGFDLSRLSDIAAHLGQETVRPEAETSEAEAELPSLPAPADINTVYSDEESTTEEVIHADEESSSIPVEGSKTEVTNEATPILDVPMENTPVEDETVKSLVLSVPIESAPLEDETLTDNEEASVPETALPSSAESAVTPKAPESSIVEETPIVTKISPEEDADTPAT